MNNPTVDNDLQKAIDDITKATGADPMFEGLVPEATVAEVTEVAGPAEVAPEPVSEPMAKPVAVPAGRPMVDPMIAAPGSLPPAPTFSAPTPMPPIAEPMAAPAAPVATETTTFEATTSSDLSDVKVAALRDLVPLMDKMDLSPSQKFGLYKDVRENLHDDSVIAPAYEAAKDIADDRERGEALLYVVESIDKK